MSSAKIVGIRGGEEVVQGYQNPAKPLAMPLVKLRDAMKQKVHALLRKLFENADDALFEMADKAGSNGDQALYFDAMRELRLQKKHIATGVIKGLIQSFNELGHYRGENQTKGLHESELEELSVIQNDELEMSVAVEGMVNRVRNACGQSLDDLKERCEYLMSPMQLRGDQTPGAPEMLAECFSAGMVDLEVSIRARLVVLKLFEKYVLNEMPQVYQDANQLLVQQGVLPEIKKHRMQVKAQSLSNEKDVWARDHKSVPEDDSAVPTLGSPIGSGGSGAGAGAFLDDLRGLMHPEHASGGSNAEPPMLSDVFYSQQELVSALSQFQINSELPAVTGQKGQVLDFRALLDQRLAGEHCKASYTEMDADIINLVSMLFEFILDDRQLQATMKALIGRLQIPILKVALMDRSFFNKGGHPARKLLNEIASAAIGWNEVDEGKVDRLRTEIETVVNTVIDEFDQDMALFERLLESFKTFMDVERRRGQLVEQRTKDSEQGKAASEKAKLQVQNVLNAALAEHHAPESAIELLRDGWSKVMIIHHLKHGEDSREWCDSCRVVEELLWTLDPSEDEGMSAEVLQQSLVQRIPVVVQSLREGLESVSFDEFRTKSLLHELEQAHVEVLQKLRLQAEADLAEQEQSDAVAELVRETEALEADFNMESVKTEEQAAPEDQTEARAELDQPAEAESSLSESEAEGENHEEIVLVSLEPEAGTPTELDENDPFVQQVDKFSVGCWFEFSGEERNERCKLAAVIRATGKYIFVNRSGIKVAEKTRMGLAVELRRGSLQILNDGLLFDRALESIITNLRGKQNQAEG